MSRTELFLRGIARWSVGIAMFIAPWLFGSAEPWSYLVIGSMVLIGAAFYLTAILFSGHCRIRGSALSGVLFLILGLMFLQILPLPAKVVGVLNPVSVKSVDTWNDVAGKMAGANLDAYKELEKKPTLSVAPVKTMCSAYLYSIYLLAFIVMANNVIRWSQVRGVLLLLIGGGFLLALIGIAQKFSGSELLLWIHSPRHGGNPFATFTNRNHFATHALLLFGASLGLFFASSFMGRHWSGEDWREKMSDVTTSRAGKTGLLAVITVVIGAAVVFSLSRGAILSLVVSVLLLLGALVWFRSLRKARALLLLVFLILTCVIWLGLLPVAERLVTLISPLVNPTADTRFQATLDTLKILGTMPFTGCGFGCFEHAFPLFCRGELQFGWWLHAHNDWAQLLAESGLLGGSLVALAIYLFLRIIVRRASLAGEHARRLVIGLMTGIVAVLLQAFLDYGLHRPANAIVLAGLLGLVVGLLYQRSRAVTEEQMARLEAIGVAMGDDDYRRLSGKAFSATFVGRLLCRLCASLVLVAVVALLAVSFIRWRGEIAFKRFEYGERIVLRTHDAAMKDKAVHSAVMEVKTMIRSRYCSPGTLRLTIPSLVGWALNKDLSLQTRIQAAQTAVHVSAHVVQAVPSDAMAWIWLGRSESLVGNWEEADQMEAIARMWKPKGPSPVLFLPARP